MSQNPSHAALDTAIYALGEELWKRMKGETPGVFNKDFWQGRILEWAMKDPSFKVDMFRFVDVLPTLQTKEQVSQHVREYLLKEGRELPAVMTAALKAASGGLTAGLAAMTIKKQVTDMASRFIVGENAAQAIPVLKKLHKEGIAFTVDLLGEATLSEGESDAYAARYLDLIENLANECSKWSADSVIDSNHMGALPRVNVSLKISAMYSQIDPVDPVGSISGLKDRVLPLFLRAKERNVFLNVDLEQWALHDLTYELFEEVLAHPELKTWPHVGIVVQAYLRKAEQDVHRLIELAKRRGAPITVRLVKGAYWDYETVIARQEGWECPVFQDKALTDQNYERLSGLMLDNIEHIYPAFGSHNLRSVTHALVQAKEKKVPENAYELQTIYGMAEPERKVFRGLGHRVRVYAPVGEMLPGMAYLVRRLLENTSNSGFLRLSHVDGADTRELLAAPGSEVENDSTNDEPSAKPKMVPGDLSTPYTNCPLTDFTVRERQSAIQAAVNQTLTILPVSVPVVVGSQERRDTDAFTRICPSDTTIEVAHVHPATQQDVDRALACAEQAFPKWRATALSHRAALLEKLGDILEADRDALTALISVEVGKPWKGADADVAEAVDFCRYYARRAEIELGPKVQGDVEGEDNVLFYEGRGPTVVIAPWNFPLAILCGMAGAALVAGNPVILKPAEQSSAVAWALYRSMMRAGFAPDVVQFLPGIGEDIGPALVEDPRTAQIAFTGSQSVGLRIIEQAGITVSGQPQVKRVVCEMGGKNAIIVDDDADLDEAVHGVVDSAFGFSGQKCSACSRALVVGSAAAPFVQRLVDATGSLVQGPAHDPGSFFGPVVDLEARERLLALINSPGEGAKLLWSGAKLEGGYFVPAAIFEVSDIQHPLMTQEFFGPVLTIMRVSGFEEAIQAANQTEYALTGAVYSRSPAHLELARQTFRVGNLYLNCGSTGALVGRQPFGGFQRSGIGTKAGGPGYLVHFADPRVVTENTMRRGFTPDLES